MKKVVIATGGTGGHIFPAVSLAESLAEKNAEVHVVSDKRFNNYPPKGKSNSEGDSFNLHFLSVSNPQKKIKFVVALIADVIQVVKLFVKIKPDILVGFGGYATLPTLIVGTILRIRIVLHEANSILGTVNKLFLPFCSHLTLAMPLKEGVPRNKHSKNHTVIGGLLSDKIAPVAYPQIDQSFVISVLGGSQGAPLMTSVVAQAILEVAKKNTKYKIKVFHQSGQGEVEKNQKLYSDANIESEVKEFFIDVEKKIADSHLIIARAGAGTISEVSTIGRPAIYIPYPNAADDHQLHNAKLPESSGAALILTDDATLLSSLIEKIDYLMNNVDVVQKMADEATKLGKTDGIKEMVALIEKLSD